MPFGRAVSMSKTAETKTVDNGHTVMFFAIVLTFSCFYVAYIEGVMDSFYSSFGPPFSVGSVTIGSWNKWLLYVSLLIAYQIFNVLMQESFGRQYEREHLQEKKWVVGEVIMLCLYNLYRWGGTVLHILVAATRFDIWLILAVVDTTMRGFLWYNPETNGRSPRVFAL
jgi:hypothetical protein